MASLKKKTIEVLASGLQSGFRVELAIPGRQRRTFRVSYPATVWRKVPSPVRKSIQNNIAYAGTHFVPLMLGAGNITYRFPCPTFESFWFQNTIRDLSCCEMADKVPGGSYVRDFLGMEVHFDSGRARSTRVPRPPSTSLKRVGLPFTFGKESMLTLGLVLRMGLTPVLLYSEEPSHPYERTWKRRELKRLSRSLGVEAIFLENSLGALRYGRALGLRAHSELGWGTQTTQLVVLSSVLAYSHRVSRILIGNECSNNEIVQHDGWPAALSFDQSSFWTPQQSLMVQSLTGGRCSVHSSLEPLEEMAIFFLLHRYFPELGKLQFSCSGEHPLVRGSQWCHSCYKCARMFLFARCCEIDPFAIGFKRDLLEEPRHFEHYFGTSFALGSVSELDFSFLTLERKKRLGCYERAFKRRKPQLPSWESLAPSFTRLKPALNLDPRLKPRLLAWFEKGLRDFREVLSVNYLHSGYDFATRPRLRAKKPPVR